MTAIKNNAKIRRYMFSCFGTTLVADMLTSKYCGKQQRTVC